MSFTEAGRGGDPDILIVDDDVDLATVIELALTAHSFRTSIAFNGQEALDSIAEHMPSLIILDMMMPVMDGRELARIFHARYGHAAPILLLTAADDARARAAEIGAEGYLAKPFETKKLIASVNQLLATQPPRETVHDHAP